MLAHLNVDEPFHDLTDPFLAISQSPDDKVKWPFGQEVLVSGVVLFLYNKLVLKHFKKNILESIKK